MKYKKNFTKPYSGGYKDKPDKTTPVTADILNMQDNTFEAIEEYLANLKTDLPDDVEINNSLRVGNPSGAKAGAFSLANGMDCTASGAYSHAEGYGTSATGSSSSHAEGIQTKATGQAAHAEGVNTEASGSIASHAEGNGTKATEAMAHAEGYKTVGSGAGSHAEGNETKASGQFQHVQGKYNIEDTENKYAHIVGGGTSDTDRKNIHTLDWNGNAEFAGDVRTGNGASLDDLNEQSGSMAENISTMQTELTSQSKFIVELDKAVTENKTAVDTSLAEVNKTLQKHTEDITAVNTELTSQSKALGELADKKITKFYASSQGDITLSDSDDGKMQDMMLYGKSEQKQYSGKNLCGILKQNTVIVYNTGLETTNSAYCCTDYIPVTSGEHYTIVGGTNGNENWYYSSDKTPVKTFGGVWTAKTITIPDGIAYIRCSVQTKNIDTFQIEKGSESTAYEPYVGGIPSPNPDYPQEIKSVVEPVVKVTGKNLAEPLMPTTTSHRVTCTNNGDGTYTLNGTADGNTTFRLDQPTALSATNLKAYKGKYTLSKSDTSYRVCLMQNSTWANVINVGIGYKSTTVSINHSNCFIVIFIIGGTTYNNVLVDVQLEKNDTATDFEPYTAQSVPLTGITLNAIPVSSGGNVTIDGQKYISDYVDVERGKVVRMVGKKILNGTETWTVQTEIGDGKVLYTPLNVAKQCVYSNVDKPNFNPVISDMLLQSKVNYNRIGLYEISLYNTEGIKNYPGKNWLYIGINKTKDELVQFLQENNITVYYPLATHTEESISDELAEKLKALQTYYPQTNLFITSNQLDGYAIFNYPISLANGWNYVKQQIGDTRDYIYDMDLQMAQAYVNSEYAVALTELEV